MLKPKSALYYLEENSIVIWRMEFSFHATDPQRQWNVFLSINTLTREFFPSSDTTNAKAFFFLIQWHPGCRGIFFFHYSGCQCIFFFRWHTNTQGHIFLPMTSLMQGYFSSQWCCGLSPFSTAPLIFVSVAQNAYCYYTLHFTAKQWQHWNYFSTSHPLHTFQLGTAHTTISLVLTPRKRCTVWHLRLCHGQWMTLTLWTKECHYHFPTIPNLVLAAGKEGAAREHWYGEYRE